MSKAKTNIRAFVPFILNHPFPDKVDKAIYSVPNFDNQRKKSEVIGMKIKINKKIVLGVVFTFALVALGIGALVG